MKYCEFCNKYCTYDEMQCYEVYPQDLEIYTFINDIRKISCNEKYIYSAEEYKCIPCPD